MTLQLLIAEARALLELERGRSSGFTVAMRAWLQGLAWRWTRMRSLGWVAHARLLRAEQACFRAGLAYRREGDEQRAPWHLPSRFVSLAAAELPPHPLLDPSALAATATPALGAQPLAPEALAWWLSPAASAWRGQGLPLLNANSSRDSNGDQRTGLAPATGRMAVCMHLYYAELWPELWSQLSALPRPFDLVVTVPDFVLAPCLQKIIDDCPGVRFALAPNRGRDVLPWLGLLQQGAFDGYDVVCKLHGKNSPHTAQAQRWRQDSVGSLVGNNDNAVALLAALRADPTIGVLGPCATAVLPEQDAWKHQNARHLRLLATRLTASSGGPVLSGAAWPFFAGTMFWFRPAALKALVGMGLQPGDFASEMGQTDGTLAHAIERFLAPVAERAGYRLAGWDPAARRVVPLTLNPTGNCPAINLLKGTS